MSSIRRKYQLLCSLLTGRTVLPGPFSVAVDITGRCNLNCIGCPAHSKEAGARPDRGVDVDIPSALFEKICSEFALVGTKRMLMIGEGEPFLHPQLLALIGIAKAHSFRLDLLTNGTLLDEANARAIAGSGLDKLRVSLWGATEDVYLATNPGAVGSFHKVVDGVGRLQAAKVVLGSRRPLVALHFPINRINLSGIGDLGRLAVELGVDEVSFSPLQAWNSRFSHLALTPGQHTELGQSLRLLARELEEHGIVHNVGETLGRYAIGERVWERYPCYIGWTHVRIGVDGSVKPCRSCAVVMGNLWQHGFAEIWNGTTYADFRRQAGTRRGLAELSGQCVCGYCCHVHDNRRIDMVYRWLKPASFVVGKAMR